jgi:hypothetical protein
MYLVRRIGIKCTYVTVSDMLEYLSVLSFVLIFDKLCTAVGGFGSFLFSWTIEGYVLRVLNF